MKKFLTTLISLMFVLVAASFGFAENDVRMKGTVAQINGSRVTIKDENGQKIIMESNLKGIKVGDLVLLKGELFKVESFRTELTAQDVEFLTKQCSIDRSDVNVIPKLEEQTRMKLMSRIDRKDCKLFAQFKASREYFKSLKPKSQIPLAPAGWNIDYLTKKEFSQYAAILESAPW